MSLTSESNVKIRSRVVVPNKKPVKRRCTIDPNLPQVPWVNVGESKASSDDDENPNTLTTPNPSEPMTKLSQSLPAKRRLLSTELANPSPTKKMKSSPHYEEPVPVYAGYQLLGDSQFVRFSEQLLGYRVEFKDRLRRIGYCVSGQTIEDLRTRVCGEDRKLHTHVIVLIGTNDLVARRDENHMRRSYNLLVSHLKKKCLKIVLLTVPPVGRYADDGAHWQLLKSFNTFIFQLQDHQVDVIDLCSIFISYCNTFCSDYYEKQYGNSQRVDLIHLNTKGFKILKLLLDMRIEGDGESLRRRLF